MNTKKTSQLKQLITEGRTNFILEAHNGLSAKIVEEAGFRGIWASGLSISASLAVRDNNEASWTQVLEVAEFMSDATSVPILLDGDTGFGNFNNMRRLVRKLEQRGIAGVCIEDKVFPKTNSFLRGEKQPLADAEEFCGKIAAAKDTQIDQDFCVVARTEALIAGWGLSEALRRAEAYRQAGADAILIHSKEIKGDEIVSFLKEWGNRSPVVIVPTKYYATPTKVFKDLGVNLIIWANHMLRASLAAMQKTAETIFTSESLIEVEDKVSTLSEVFRLQNDDELQVAEERYLRMQSSSQYNAVILAASRGEEMGELSAERPKAMIAYAGKPILQRIVELMRERKIVNIGVVRGYKKEAVQVDVPHFFDNDNYFDSGELRSLYLAQEMIRGRCLICYGDVLFRKFIFNLLLEEDEEIVIVADGSKRSRQVPQIDAVKCTSSFSERLDDAPVYLQSIESVNAQRAEGFDGEWIGLMKTNPSGSEKVRAGLLALKEDPRFDELDLNDLLSYLLSRGMKIRVLYIDGHWLHVTSIKDIVDSY